MASINKELVYAAINRAYALTDNNTVIDKRNEFRQQTICTDSTLTKEEKSEAINILCKNHDYNKVIFNQGIKRECENCKLECLASSYCEQCLQSYLKAKFPEWTSGNNEIDNLIKKCQMEAFVPSRIVEWIPFDKLQNVKYLTKGGYSEIYTADWIDGSYNEWDSIRKQLIRYGRQKVILKRLENVESANRSWFEEVCNLKHY